MPLLDCCSAGGVSSRSAGAIPNAAIAGAASSRSVESSAAMALAPATTTATIKCITQATSGTAARSATFNVTLNCTPGAGDALIASVYAAGTTVPASAATITADVPAGFSQLGAGPSYSGSLGQANLSYRIATGTETSITVTDPANAAYAWAVTIYDVQTPGAMITASTATSTLSPSTPSITPTTTNSLAIGIWATQNTDVGPPSQPGFWPQGGWTKTTGASPQFTRIAGATNNVVQGSAYRTLTAATAISVSTSFYNGGNLATDAGVAQIVLISPGSNATPTPSPTPTPTPTSTPVVDIASNATTPSIKCITQANSGTAPLSSTFSFALACAPNPGDALIASVYTAGAGVPSGAAALTADIPAGFTQLGSGATFSGASGEADLSSKMATGSESTITITDPAFNAFAWAVTIYDVAQPGAITTASAATSTLSPVTPSIAATATHSIGIALWGIQNSDSGPPSSPGLWPSGGWTKTTGSAPQFTRIARATNNVLQGSAYSTLTSTAPFTVAGGFYNGGNLATSNGVAQIVVIAPGSGSTIIRRGFLGAFYRAIGPPPYGVFSATATPVAPQPYPTPGTTLFGTSGYCQRVAANGVSIATGQPVDPTKLADIVNLGVKWARMTIAASYIDQSHIFTTPSYSFLTLDAAQCALAQQNITPVVGIEAGPVDYNAIPGTYSPTLVPTYESAADFATYCGALAQHENAVFGASTRYSIPDNEVNTDTTMFPGGATQIAAYSKACYSAIKAIQPNAFVYGFELNMQDGVGAPAFVQQLAGLGCKVGTCYDGISIHLFMPYPIPSSSTPCYPSAGGNYDIQCVTAIRTAAANASLHVLIGETAFMVPATVPDEATKALAVVAAMNLFAADPNIDGVDYANVDECALYPTGEFAGGCLINTAGAQLPAYAALSTLAAAAY